MESPTPFANPRGIPHVWYTKRVPISETTIWVIEATLVEYAMERNDDDYHLVLKDGDKTMIAEIPDPSCVERAPKAIRERVQIAHDDLYRRFTGRLRPVYGTFKPSNVRVRIAGIGMFDKIHGGGERRT
jgi:hypothetical protein